MQNVKLVIGSKTRSSWSLRPWLFMKHHGLRFDEIVIPLGQSDTRKRILEHSPSGKVPCLRHGSIRVWESLAICEYAAETFALPRAWPLDPAARALARSMATEMHASFADLRRELPFDTQRSPVAQKVSDAAEADIRRVRALWRQARARHGDGGPWLFGQFGICDAMFAPVALRFHQYQIPLEGPEREYMFQVLMHPAVQDWLDDSSSDGMEGELAGERTSELTHRPAVRLLPGESFAGEEAAARTQEIASVVAARPRAVEPVEAPPREQGPPPAEPPDRGAAAALEDVAADQTEAMPVHAAGAAPAITAPAAEPVADAAAAADEEPVRYDDTVGAFDEDPTETLSAPLAAFLEIAGAAPVAAPGAAKGKARAPAPKAEPEPPRPPAPADADADLDADEKGSPKRLRSTILPP